MSYVFPACNHFLLCELAGEVPRSILQRGNCSFAALTSERLLAAHPQPASYSFSHCRALPLGTDHIGLMQLLPRDAQSLLSLCEAQEVFRSCLPSGTSVAASLLWCGEPRMSSQPQRCSLGLSHRPPLAGCLALGQAAVNQPATLPISAAAQGGETLVAWGREEEGQ